MCWELAADRGDAPSMFNLGALDNGQGDAEGALAWFVRAAEAGETDAMRLLGSLLDDEGDAEGARFWYERAEEAGAPGREQPGEG
ncbi:hypothetical protein OG756_29700 [Streptomyces sp. NBC_01310]|uniref:hypothetical protein n=1 Tax=Streptomyces sp. NBC_01310 TaxID=2903820 RepID=UPI0035B648A8|nr:hypothetical protein OG756_29700 [Streptomyces sp. NBC_01310]